MANRQIQVARDKVVLGALSESDARQLLEIGFFRATDIFWAENMSAWKELRELAAENPCQNRPRQWFERAKKSASTAASAVVGSAAIVTGRIKIFAVAKKVSPGEAASAALEGYIPQIKNVLSRLADTKPVQALRAGVGDDDLMRKVFGAAYDCLPRPVCRFISEQRFVDFCMQHKRRLLDS